MALFYKLDGTVEEVIINAIIESKVTSSLAVAPMINGAHTASQALYMSAKNANSSSNQAYELAYPTNKSDWTSINGVLTSPKNQ